MEPDSLDISQLKAFALNSSTSPQRASTHADRPLHSSRRPRSSHGNRYSQQHGKSSTSPPTSFQHQSSMKKQIPTQYAPASQHEIFDTTSGSTKKRMSGETQKSGSTEALSQWVYEEPSANPHLIAQQELQSGVAPQTYTTGEDGYVELELQDGDDLELESQIDGHLEIYPESKRFQPETPATAGKKRDYNGNLMDHVFATPRLPSLNPFRTRSSPNVGVMSMSQVFKATQAPSSSFTAALVSEVLSERPSPAMENVSRTITAGPSSSPAKIERSVTEPHVKWNDNLEEQPDTRSSPVVSSAAKRQISLSDDDLEFGGDSAPVRNLKQQQKAKEGRDQLKNVRMRLGPKPSSGLRGRTVPRGQSRVKSSPLSKPKTISISDSDDETELEEEVSLQEGDEIDELGDDNKENIEIPRTVARHFTMSMSGRRSSLSSPSVRRSARARPEEDSADELANTLPSRPVLRSSHKAKATAPGSQEIAIPDSQASPSSRRTRNPHASTGPKSTVFGSSDGSKHVIPESQHWRTSSKLPNASQIDSSIARKSLPPPLSRLQTSPPSQKAGVERTVATPTSHLISPGKSAQTGIEMEIDAIGSSPPALRKRNHGKTITKLSDLAVEPLDSETGIEGPFSPASNNEVRDFLSGVPAQGISTSTKQGQPSGIRQSPLGHRATLASTILETDKTFPGFQSPNRQLFSISVMESTEAIEPSMPAAREVSSTGPALFETAATNLPGSFREPRASSLRPGSSHRPSSPKMFTDFMRADIVEEDETLDSLFPDSLLTEEDKQFTETMKKLPSPSSPRRRARGSIRFEQRRTDHLAPRAEDLPARFPTLSSITHHQSNERSSEPETLEQTGEKGLGGSDDLAEKENRPRPSRVFSGLEKASNRPDRTPPRSLSSTKESSTTSTLGSDPITKATFVAPQSIEADVQPRPAPPHLRKPSTPRLRNISNSEKKEAIRDRMGTDEGTINTTSELPMARSRRVLALFKGQPLGYYPATCLSMNPDEPKYEVEFDDGTVSHVNSGQVKRLELRVGDELKIDHPGLKKNLYTVQSLRGNGADTEKSPTTDVFGHHSVVVAQKSRGGATEDVREQVFSIASIYYTAQMWSSVKDRAPISQPKGACAEDAYAQEVSSSRPISPATSNLRLRVSKLASKLLSTRVPSISKTTQAERGVFSSIIFAVTGIRDNKIREQTQDLIRSNGGRILDNSFEELFTIPMATTVSGPPQSSSSSLSESSRGSTPISEPSVSANSVYTVALSLRASTDPLSPTLLLADKHSRNAKYFQALALGIPCLHTRWVRDCISQHKLLEWHPYLLAAGESAYLQGTIVSRSLPYPQDRSGSENWGLQKMIEGRSKWLAQKRVLLVSADIGSKIDAYLFIALALGAIEVRVARGREEARRVLLDDVDKWHWVCVNEDERSEGEAHAAAGRKGRPTKRRKSGKQEQDEITNTEVDMVEGITSVKVVSTECVVQSLILGRMLEPWELDST